MIRVDFERCIGCGICAEYCPQKAIRIVDERAVIDDLLCNQCEACIGVCPQGALSRENVVVLAGKGQPIALPMPVISRDTPAVRSADASWHRRILPILGTALSLAAREIIPRVVDALISAPAERYSLGPSPSSTRGFTGGASLRRRRRRRSAGPR